MKCYGTWWRTNISKPGAQLIVNESTGYIIKQKPPAEHFAIKNKCAKLHSRIEHASVPQPK